MLGKFVTFEGCEGVGKSTQIKNLCAYLDQTGADYILTREPGGTDIAEAIRELILKRGAEPLTEAFLFAAARADHVNRVIIPALQAGKLVLCDRFLDSSVAYQGFGRGLGVERVLEINREAVCNVTIDATVFLNLSPEHMWRKSFGDDVIEQAGMDFHKRVYEGFLYQLSRESRFIDIVPDTDKAVTSQKIIDALRARGIIK